MLQDRVHTAIDMLCPYRQCPRRCGADRLTGEVGVCRTGREVRVASFSHFGEEAPLVGTGGSGVIFFGSCNFLCSFIWSCRRALPERRMSCVSWQKKFLRRPMPALWPSTTRPGHERPPLPGAFRNGNLTWLLKPPTRPVFDGWTVIYDNKCRCLWFYSVLIARPYLRRV